MRFDVVCLNDVRISSGHNLPQLLRDGSVETSALRQYLHRNIRLARRLNERAFWFSAPLIRDNTKVNLWQTLGACPAPLREFEKVFGRARHRMRLHNR